MSAESDLYDALRNASGVTAIVGSGSSARIYPDLVPQEGAVPCIAYGRTDTEYATTVHNGTPVAERPSLEAWCMAATRIAADALAAQVIAAAGAAGFLLTARAAIEPNEEQRILATVLTFSRWYPT